MLHFKFGGNQQSGTRGNVVGGFVKMANMAVIFDISMINLQLMQLVFILPFPFQNLNMLDIFMNSEYSFEQVGSNMSV